MKFSHLIVQGFRSFNKIQDLRFDEMPPGLYHVTGVNKVQTALEGNGVGKSSLFEALYWGLYGCTSRNLKGPRLLKNWNENSADMEVVVVFDNDRRVFRAQSKLQLYSGSSGWAEISQEELAKVLVLSEDAFLHSVYFAQFTDAFVDLKPEARMHMYGTVMNLELWEDASENASSSSKLLLSSIQKTRESVERVKGELEALDGTSYDKEVRDWNVQHQHLMRELEVAVSGNQKRENEIERQLKGLPTDGERDELLLKAGKLDSQINEQSREIKNIQNRLDAKKIKNYKNCPTCGAPWTRKHSEEETRKLENDLSSRQDIRDELHSLHTNVMKKMEVLDVDFRKRQDLEKLLTEAQIRIKTSETELHRRSTEINPYVKKQQELDRRIESLKRDLTKISQQLQTDEQFLAASQYWTKGFKELRLGLIEESLEQLNVEVNESLHELGLEGWHLKFDVERETRRGTIKPGFQCMVKSPTSREGVPWEVWSGGESQRLRIAASMGISNLILSRTGTECNLEMWDEPSTWLSKAGIEDLLQILSERAKRLDKIILLADHRALDFGDFAGTITITKDENGSTIHGV